MNEDRLMDEEWKAWQEVIRRLKETKAITQKDADAPKLENDTPGKKLIHEIQFWGDVLASLRVYQDQRKE